MHRQVSVIISNYNYAEYVAMAIESALIQNYLHMEVIVVDDGSTDGSREIIERLSDAVRVIFKENGGHASAMNAGFLASKGDIVMFLDSDDFLHPDALSKIVSAWTDDCAKVQFRLSLIDSNDERRGADPPRTVKLPNGDVLPELLNTGQYLSPMMSGNAYNRRALKSLFPIPEEDFRIEGDGYLNVLVPFYGSIVSLDEELASYRLHARNLWTFSQEVTAERLRERVRHALVKQQHLERTAPLFARKIPPDLMLRNFPHVLERLSSLRLDQSNHPVPSDNRFKLLSLGISALLRAAGPTWADRGFFLCILLALAFLPAQLAQAPIQWALVSRPRARWLQFLARVLRSISGARKAP
jgi:glycosyltransferase involved in cell wall biosynthesis